MPRMVNDGEGWHHVSSHSLAIDDNDISLSHGRNDQTHSTDMPSPGTSDLRQC
jgi:hypothetical protein